MHHDPLFDEPYEPAAVSEPSARGEAATPAPSQRAISPGIKPKKKVAALLGGAR
jgi:hypothetical protein